VSRAYLRKDPGFFERKAIDQGYPSGAYTALDGVLCLAESQPQRGRFRDARLLKALLGPYGRWVSFLLEHGDLVSQADGRLYVEGWDEWQEGDWKVGERVARIRGRKRSPVTKPTVTKDTVATVVPPSDGGRPAKSLTNPLGSGGGDKSESGAKTPAPGARSTGLRPIGSVLEGIRR
jgi:hypothetical protein